MPSRSTQACASNLSPSLRTPTLRSEPMPCRLSNHQSASDSSRQVGWPRLLRTAARTMRTVNWALLDAEVSAGWPGRERNSCRNACVLRNPRKRKLKDMKGNNAAARRKSVRAGRSSALNRRSRSHIFGLDLKQPVIDEPPQQFRKMQAKQFRLNIEFVLELAIRSVNARRSGDKLPHARAGFVQTEVAFCLQIQEHGFLIKDTHKNVRKRFSAISK